MAAFRARAWAENRSSAGSHWFRRLGGSDRFVELHLFWYAESGAQIKAVGHKEHGVLRIGDREIRL
jgi:hypothetical protein